MIIFHFDFSLSDLSISNLIPPIITSVLRTLLGVSSAWFCSKFGCGLLSLLSSPRLLSFLKKMPGLYGLWLELKLSILTPGDPFGPFLICKPLSIPDSLNCYDFEVPLPSSSSSSTRSKLARLSSWRSGGGNVCSK